MMADGGKSSDREREPVERENISTETVKLSSIYDLSGEKQIRQADTKQTTRQPRQPPKDDAMQQNEESVNSARVDSIYQVRKWNLHFNGKRDVVIFSEGSME